MREMGETLIVVSGVVVLTGVVFALAMQTGESIQNYMIRRKIRGSVVIPYVTTIGVIAIGMFLLGHCFYLID